jgi:MFS family permease
MAKEVIWQGATEEKAISIHIKINRVIKFLVLGDFLFLGGWSLINPLFSVFVVENIVGATLATAGFTSSLYWLVKSVCQMPIANYLDKQKGEKDEFYALVFALMLSALTAFSFAFVKNIPQLFVVQFFHAVSMALYIPSWTSLFTHHLDKKHVSFDWALNSTVMGFAACFAAGISGVLARVAGFQAVFFIVGALSMASALMLLSIPNFIIPKKKNNINHFMSFRNYFSSHTHR